jgi:hypothetical protein
MINMTELALADCASSWFWCTPSPLPFLMIPERTGSVWRAVQKRGSCAHFFIARQKGAGGDVEFEPPMYCLYLWTAQELPMNLWTAHEQARFLLLPCPLPNTLHVLGMLHGLQSRLCRNAPIPCSFHHFQFQLG